MSTDLRQPIVVGIDGSESSDTALDWAATLAAAEGRTLQLLTAVALPGSQSGAWLESHGIDRAQVRVQAKEQARALLRHSAARVRDAHPDLDVQSVVGFEDPRDALLEVDADLVVVGTRGLGPVQRLFLGSVATTITKHATHPTVVVRPSREHSGASGVLVGIAGDAGDAAAVDLAFRVAVAHGLPLTALHSVWDVVEVDEDRDATAEDPEYGAERLLLDRALGQAVGRHPEVEVHRVVTRGFADERLIAASHRAELVVVGHRRKPFLNELIYGSAAPRIVDHAACSVAVVPYQDDSEQTGTAPALP